MKIDIENLGENYREVQESDLPDEFECLKERIASHTAVDEVEADIANYKEIVEEVESAGADEVVILAYGRYFETIPATMMNYSYDVHNWEIGVVFFEEEEEEETEEEAE